ncbi:hypothetical protein Afer_1456 [Acidimicrobium ferrooxidans DSM 10331]|uniref:EamA domain-containing protein n=1 Tax=Acidimicrobium ferrooxidans (strain DSM 10331 / JCM 15462 / NBRC 103882 / ICP) TaxID=525909 RepID=C7M071_ACIFD|nr:DMT family transporter [Acidimicrobium ferrooxidans]ACU54379.1 hypothetical protein Afer_1456 [Acidimicrobium ferrooxidans DSM 10331]
MRAIVSVAALVVIGLPRVRHLAPTVAAGVAIVLGYYGATTLGYAIAPATIASLGLASEPLVVGLLNPHWLRSPRTLATVTLAVAAMVLPVTAAHAGTHHVVAGIGLVALGGACFVIGARLLPASATPRDAVRTTTFAQALGAIVLAAVLAGTGRFAVATTIEPWLLVAVLVAGSSLVGIALYVGAARDAPAIAASSLSLVPPLGAALAWGALGDPMTWQLALSAIVAALAVYLGARSPTVP